MLLFSIILSYLDLQPFYLASMNDKLPVVVQALDPKIICKPDRLLFLGIATQEPNQILLKEDGPHCDNPLKALDSPPVE